MKHELLMPAGDLFRLKIALLYGGDAVFIGGKNFSLRAKASNFTIEDIAEGVSFAHSLNKKVYVTVNIIPHYQDLEHIKEYLIALDKCHIDAIIVSSIYIMKLVRELNLHFEIHVSTQVSAMNKETLDFYQSLGATRVVLARECSMEEITLLSKQSKIEIETFIHGGLCSSISGRCSLSNYLARRDANRGGCAHSCRWEYYLYDENKHLIIDVPFTIGSKDLNGINYLPSLIASNVTSFKIEGRMKSAYYLAKCASIYRRVIDAIIEKNNVEKELPLLEKELIEMENRELTEGFLKGYINKDDLISLEKVKSVKQIYLGYVENYQNNIVTLIRKNDILNHEKIRVIAYDRPSFIIEIINLRDENGLIEVANKTENKVYFESNIELKPYYILEKLR